MARIGLLIAVFAALTGIPEQERATAIGIPGVVAGESVVELVREGFVFTEGPVGTADGGLFFSDLMGTDRTYRMDPDGAITVVREHTNRGNGLALTRNGDLLVAEGDGKRVSKVGPDGQAVSLTEGSADRPLLSPNDLIVDARGGIYFTDPGPRPVVPGRKAYVYYLPVGNRAKVPTAAIEYLRVPRQPANVAFSGPDKRTLYITAREGLYRLRVLSQGPERLGK